MKKIKSIKSTLCLATTIGLAACNSGGGNPNNVPKQNNLPQVACSASLGGGWESSGTILFNPPIAPQRLGLYLRAIHYDNRPSATNYLEAGYGEAVGDWDTRGAIDIPVPVYAIGGGTSHPNDLYLPSELPSDVCTYMYSTETYTTNLMVIPETVNHGVMAWRNCSASITNGVMSFNANYELYLNSLNTEPVESGTVTFTCNNINNVQPPTPLPRTSTKAKTLESLSGDGNDVVNHIDLLRHKESIKGNQ